VGVAARVRSGLRRFSLVPVDYLELRARVRSLVRRWSPGGVQRPAPKPLVIDHSAGERAAGRRVELSRQWALLTRLAADPLRVFTNHELLRDVCRYPAEASTRSTPTPAGCGGRSNAPERLATCSTVAGSATGWWTGSGSQATPGEEPGAAATAAGS
jgi:hypothetical protein